MLIYYYFKVVFLGKFYNLVFSNFLVWEMQKQKDTIKRIILAIHRAKTVEIAKETDEFLQEAYKTF